MHIQETDCVRLSIRVLSTRVWAISFLTPPTQNFHLYNRPLFHHLRRYYWGCHFRFRCNIRFQPSKWQCTINAAVQITREFGYSNFQYYFHQNKAFVTLRFGFNAIILSLQEYLKLIFPLYQCFRRVCDRVCSTRFAHSWQHRERRTNEGLFCFSESHSCCGCSCSCWGCSRAP